MGFDVNAILFWGGIAVAGGSLLGLLIFFCISQIKKVHLEAILNAEYGEQKKK